MKLSKLFSEAWMKAMSLQNIVSGFSATDIYHLDRSVLTSAQTTNTLEKPRLPYVPLFTPSRRVSITQSPV